MVANLLRFLRRYWLGIFVAALLGGAAGLFFAWRFPVVFEVSQTIFVKRQTATPSPQFYTYDGYYSAQAAERFTDSLAGFLRSREILRFLLTESDSRNISTEAAGHIVAAIKVKRLSPQLVIFSYRNNRLGEAKLVVADLTRGLSQLAADVSRAGDEGISLHFINREPLVIVKSQNYLLSGGVGLFLGSFFSLILFLFWDYLVRTSHE